MGNAYTLRTLFTHCTTHRPDIVCIAEPKIEFSAVPTSYWSSLGLRLVASNDALLPSIWLLFSSSVSDPSWFEIGNQHISVDVMSFNVPHRLSFFLLFMQKL